MNWLLLLGIGLLIFGAWIWFQRNRPASPLLYDDALIELHATIQSIKNDMISSENTSAVLPTESKKMMLSYIYQGQKLDDRTIYIHNISLTIPEQAAEFLKWDSTTQKKIAQFVCAVLDAPSSPTVHKAQNSILSINLLFQNREAHEAFVKTKVPDLISVEGLNASKYQLTIEDMTERSVSTDNEESDENNYDTDSTSDTTDPDPNNADGIQSPEGGGTVLDTPNTATV